MQACTFKPEQVSAQKAAKGRALLMSGVPGLDSPAQSSRFSAVAAMDDLDKYEVSKLIHLCIPEAYSDVMQEMPLHIKGTCNTDFCSLIKHTGSESKLSCIATGASAVNHPCVL